MIQMNPPETAAELINQNKNTKMKTTTKLLLADVIAGAITARPTFAQSATDSGASKAPTADRVHFSSPVHTDLLAENWAIAD